MLECPVSFGRGQKADEDVDSRNMMPKDLETIAEGHIDLNIQRIKSSIPKADVESPENWLYPSPQMFYNAMRKKGHVPNANDMDVIVTIHNIVNEQTWQQVRKQEKMLYPGSEPRLKRFLGRPESSTPKALFRSYILGYGSPFDRHDWYVERSNGTVVRYVIDFYSGRQSADNSIPSFHIDARQALDTPRSFVERIRLLFAKMSPSSGHERIAKSEAVQL